MWLFKLQIHFITYQESDYWTKYTFADNQTNKAHGLFGSKPDGTPLAAWWVVNQRDTFFGGPVCAC